jgi:hypothetical protein
MNLEMQVPGVPKPLPDAPKKGIGRPRKTALRNPLAPYRRCRCGVCAMCKDNAKWDRIFAKFEVSQYTDIKGVFQSPLKDVR